MPDLLHLLSVVNPGLIVILAGLLLPIMRSSRLAQTILLLGGPAVAMLALLARPGDAEPVRWLAFGLELIIYRIDALSRIFALAFILASFLGGLYSLHRRDFLQDAAGMVYGGAAIAAVLVGDFLSLFVFWEMTALASVFLILARRTEQAHWSGMRYLVIQIISGVLLLAGAVLLAGDTGSFLLPGFDPSAPSVALSLRHPGALLIFLAFGIKAAFPLLHNWLQDSYPNATETGAVILSAFTTKLAVYALARCFPGTESLILIGAIMTVFPVFFAVIENDLRKVLSYSLNNQVGFMVCAIGVGTPLALNGAALHAFVHIIYKALLFMSMGAVMLRVGKTCVTDLGGLWRSMPLSALFCMIGAASIAGFPLFSGFVAKSLTFSAVSSAHLPFIWIMLLFASAGVMEHSGIKIPYCAFFGPDRGLRPREAPANMLIAMAIAAAICILAGVAPQWLYALAPYRVEAMSYLDHALWTSDHVLTQLQLLVFASLAFVLLKRFHLYPEEKIGLVLDSDWLYRRPGYLLLRWAGRVVARVEEALALLFGSGMQRLSAALVARFRHMGRVFGGEVLAVWTVIVLGVVLIVAGALQAG